MTAEIEKPDDLWLRAAELRREAAESPLPNRRRLLEDAAERWEALAQRNEATKAATKQRVSAADKSRNRAEAAAAREAEHERAVASTLGRLGLSDV